MSRLARNAVTRAGCASAAGVSGIEGGVRARCEVAVLEKDAGLLRSIMGMAARVVAVCGTEEAATGGIGRDSAGGRPVACGQAGRPPVSEEPPLLPAAALTGALAEVLWGAWTAFFGFAGAMAVRALNDFSG